MLEFEEQIHKIELKVLKGVFDDHQINGVLDGDLVRIYYC